MKLIILIYKFFLSRRYKVEIKNLEVLKHNGPVLLLPNHVALIDPQILMSFLRKTSPQPSPKGEGEELFSPVASEKFFEVPVLKQVMQAVGTIPIGEMQAGADSEEVKKVFDKVVLALKNGKNILIYPSGEIYKQGFESIIGKKAVYNIVKNMPENTKVIGLRQTGLWGSMWSKAWDAGKTGFFTLLLKGIFIVFANFIFFVPKRKVKIELEDISAQINLYKNMSLGEFNKYLENFYNTQSLTLPLTGEGNKKFIEEINYIKHYFFYDNVKNRQKPKVIPGSLADLETTKKLDLTEVDDEIKNKIFEKIKEMKPHPNPLLKGEGTNLIMDLFFDSLDLAEIKSFVQANFSKSSNPPITELKTIGDLLIMAIGKSQNVEELKSCDWKKWEQKGDLVEKLV